MIARRRPNAAKYWIAEVVCQRRAGRRTLEITEEFAVGRNHHHVAVPAERAAIRLQAAIERVELRIAVVRRGVDGRRGRVALAADALRVGQRRGDDLGTLALGLGLDDLRLASTLAALRAARYLRSVRFMLSYTLLATSSCRSMRCMRTSMSRMPSFSNFSLASFMNSPVICCRSEITMSLQRAPRDGVLDAVLDGVAHQRFGAAFVATAGRLVESARRRGCAT